MMTYAFLHRSFFTKKYIAFLPPLCYNYWKGGYVMKHIISIILILTMSLSLCSIGASADTGVNAVKISPDFDTRKADVSATIVDNVDAYVITAYYNSNGRVVDLNMHLSKATGSVRTYEKTEDIPKAAVKARAFLWDTNYVPLVGDGVKEEPIVNTELITNGDFEGGTLDGWTITTGQETRYAVSAAAGYNSSYGMYHKKAGTTITQDITADVSEAGQGYYHLSMYAKSLNADGLSVRIRLTYALDNGAEISATKDMALTNEWSQINYTFVLGEYIKNSDGTETLDVSSTKEITSAKLTFNVQKNSGTEGNRNPHIPSSVSGSNALYHYYVDDISLIKLNNLSGNKKTGEIKGPSVFVLGDSILQTYYVANYPRQGWGYSLGDSFKDEVNWANYAVAGYSTKSYIGGHIKGSSFVRPAWPIYKNAIKEGDYVIIALGHNDTGSDPESTSVEQYKANLKTIVDDTRSAGANILFVSNLPSVAPTITDTSKNAYNKRYQEVFVPYAEELGVPCINMNLAMTDMINELFKDEAYLDAYKNGLSSVQHGIYLYNLGDNGFVESNSSYTGYSLDATTGVYHDSIHIQYRGAQYAADFIENQIKSKALGIRELLDNPETELISNGGFEVGLYDWTVPEERTFTFEAPEAIEGVKPARFGNNYGKLTTTGTISQDITIPLKAYGKKTYTLSADVTADVNVVVKVNDETVATATLSPTTKTAQINLSSLGTINNAVIEFISATECTFDNITLK